MDTKALENMSQLDAELLRICIEGYFNETQVSGERYWPVFDASEHIGQTRWGLTYTALNRAQQNKIRETTRVAKVFGILKKDKVTGRKGYQLWEGPELETVRVWMLEHTQWGLMPGATPLSAYMEVEALDEKLQASRFVMLDPPPERIMAMAQTVAVMLTRGDVELLARFKDADQRGTGKPTKWKMEKRNG